MKNVRDFKSGWEFAASTAVLAAVILSLAACAKTPTTPASAASPAAAAAPAAAPEEPLFMFVHVAEDLEVDEAAATLRLVNVGQQTLFFSDRPDRIAGHLKMAAYLDEWTDKAGKDNFGVDPPNAALSVYEPGQADNTVAVVEITNPQIDGADLIYHYKLINGNLPANGGENSRMVRWAGLS